MPLCVARRPECYERASARTGSPCSPEPTRRWTCAPPTATCTRASSPAPACSAARCATAARSSWAPAASRSCTRGPTGWRGWGYAAGGRRVVLDPGSPLIAAEERGLPIHGMLSARRCGRLVAAAPTRSSRRLDYGADAELLAAFPFPHRIELAVALRDGARGADHADRDERRTGARRLRLPSLPAAAGRRARRLGGRAARARRSSVLGAASCRPAHDRTPPSAARWARAPSTTVPPASLARALRARRRRSPGRREIGDGYPYAQVYAPPTADVVCFEPMTAPATRCPPGTTCASPRPA